MDKQEFEQMLGDVESTMRSNYIDLHESIIHHIDESAMLGIMLMQMCENITQAIQLAYDAEGIDSVKICVEGMLKDFLSLMMFVMQDLTAGPIQHHNEILHNKRIELHDIQQRKSIGMTISSFVEKYNGRGVDEMLEFFKQMFEDQEDED
jgi:hypothetical protein